VGAQTHTAHGPDDVFTLVDQDTGRPVYGYCIKHGEEYIHPLFIEGLQMFRNWACQHFNKEVRVHA
jgi:hypothetical protein